MSQAGAYLRFRFRKMKRPGVSLVTLERGTSKLQVYHLPSAAPVLCTPGWREAL